MAEINLRIDGMHCGACVRRVTNALQGVEGSTVEAVRLGAARIHTTNDSVSAQSLIDVVVKAGYSAFTES